MKKSTASSVFLRTGLPLVIFVVGGFYGLSEFVAGKVEVQDRRVKSQSLREFNLSEEHRIMTERLQKEQAEYKNIPVPSPIASDNVKNQKK